MLPLPTAWTYETGLPQETGIPGIWESTVPTSHRTREGEIHSTTAWCGSEKQVSVVGCYTSASGSTYGLEGPECGSRSGTKAAGQDVEDPGACLCRRARG